jgi:hypothetical protein
MACCQVTAVASAALLVEGFAHDTTQLRCGGMGGNPHIR